MGLGGGLGGAGVGLGYDCMGCVDVRTGGLFGGGGCGRVRVRTGIYCLPLSTRCLNLLYVLVCVSVCVSCCAKSNVFV